MKFDSRKHLPTGERACHLAIIPDGARRWSDLHSVSLEKSYQRSVEKLTQMVPLLLGAGAEELSVFCSVSQNRNRPKPEVDAFVNAGLTLDGELSRIAKTLKCKYRFIGLSLEREHLSDQLHVEHGDKVINVVFDYDPFQELLQALQRIDHQESDPLSSLYEGLLLQRPIDFVIRTGGYKTLSNFFPLLIGYSRMEFVDKLFNDVSDHEILNAFESFFSVPRRYGV